MTDRPAVDVAAPAGRRPEGERQAPRPRAPLRDIGWTENRAPSGWLPALELRELWAFRELALVLAARDLKLRYRQTLLGALWAILQPLAGAAIFSVVFGRLADVPSDGLPYPVFVFSGLIVWTYLSAAVASSAESLIQHRELVTRVYFPRLLAPLAAVLPALVDLTLSLVVLAALMAFLAVAPGLALALLPLWILGAVALAVAAGLWLSALNAQYRDVRHALVFLLQIWLFASPVFYPGSLFSNGWSFVYALNPAVGLLHGFRWSAAGGPPPDAEDAVSLLCGLLLLVGGAVYFRRVERRMADVI